MNSSKIQKPDLDPSLFEPSPFLTVVNIGYGLCMFLLFAWLNHLVAIETWPIHYKIVPLFLFSTLSAVGLYVLAILGHDAMHGNLFKNRKLSLVTGLFFSSSVLTYIDMGFVVRHWDHHRYTNQIQDPDIYPTARLRTWWQRLLLSRLLFNIEYLKNAFYMATGKMDQVARYQTPLSSQELTFYSRLNFLFAFIWLCAYIAIAFYDWRLVLFGVLMPSVILAFLAGCQSYLDHAGLGDEPYKNSYTRTSPLMSMIYFGSNYHLEHHLYPKVPGYKLPRVHRILVESGFYEKVRPPVLSGFLEAYKTLAMPFIPLTTAPAETASETSLEQKTAHLSD